MVAGAAGGVACRVMGTWRLAVLLLLLVTDFALVTRSASAQASEEEAWADWSAVLSRYAAGGEVQYGRWKSEDPAEWRRFLAWLERADPSRMPLADQRAFWINAYNASVVAGVLARYPLASVRDVGFLGGRLLGFFGKKEHLVAGRRRSLEEMRALAARPPRGDPRAHFALSLAAASSPPLRPEAYRGATLDMQLDFQTRTFLNGPRGSRLDTGRKVLYLTSILSWHENDFEENGGSPRTFAGRYLVGASAAAAESMDWKVEWLDFDWRLDEVRRE